MAKMDKCSFQIRVLGNTALQTARNINGLFHSNVITQQKASNWLAKFRSDLTNDGSFYSGFWVTDEPRLGRPTSATTEDKADAVHVTILKDSRIRAKVIAETLWISRERGDHVIHNIKDMRMFSAKWLPKYMNADEKRIKVMTLK
ncbi:uncharacterized protein LOC128247129 [Octopus bimaculoides]|uniref:uncharacterized protein LOC128247129 n=1 Tax=Octopus bimaculoides TaxID=37653 RepID=UPI0022E31938|nr:uncharacterized protein LOC128247129 [Octopus bimaculoides]